MSTPILSAQVAEDFNRIVQNQIDPRLFLFCNYQPTVSYSISEDALFADAIQDLYKFTIDTCFLLKYHRDYIPNLPFNTFRSLQKAIDLIETLRSVMDHNQSPENGWLEKERIDHYQRWLMEVLNKQYPTTQADYQRLNQELQAVASVVVQQTDLLLQTIINHRNRASISQKWYDYTLYWLTHNTRTQLYTGQLIDAYVAKAESIRSRNSSFYRLRTLNSKVKEWIERSIFYPTEEMLRNVNEKLQKEQDSLLHPSGIARSLLATMTPEERQEYQNNQRSKIARYQRQQAQLQQQLDTLQNTYGTSQKTRVKYFFDHLEDQLRQTAAFLEAQGIAYTLLPSSLMQQDIALRFAQIPFPDQTF